MFQMNEGGCDNGLGNKNMNIWIWVSFLLRCDKRKKKHFIQFSLSKTFI